MIPSNSKPQFCDVRGPAVLRFGCLDDMNPPRFTLPGFYVIDWERNDITVVVLLEP